jgi:hypothetical protein
MLWSENRSSISMTVSDARSRPYHSFLWTLMRVQDVVVVRKVIHWQYVFRFQIGYSATVQLSVDIRVLPWCLWSQSRLSTGMMVSGSKMGIVQHHNFPWILMYDQDITVAEWVSYCQKPGLDGIMHLSGSNASPTFSNHTSSTCCNMAVMLIGVLCTGQ